MRSAIVLSLLLVVTQPAFAEERLAGIGVELKFDNGALLVMSVLPNSAAARGGMREGDRIVAIDGQPLGGLSADKVGQLWADKKGPTVNLTVNSEDQPPWQLIIPRERFQVQKPQDAADDKQAGIGVELRFDKGTLVVMEALPDGPAARGGVRNGDRIVAIDGQPTAGLSPGDAAKKLAGKRGSSVTLTVTSGGQMPRQVRIRRELIDARRFKVVQAENAAVLAAAAAHNRIVVRAEVAEAFGQVDWTEATIRDALAREIEFMAKVGQLTAGERESLMEQGRMALQRPNEVVARRMNAARRVAVVVNGQNQIRRVRQPETPDQAVRRALTPVLKAISHDAWEKFDAARQRLEQRRRRADVLAQVAALDEALLLTRAQRDKLCDLLCGQWAEMWHRCDNDAADPVRLCLDVSDAFDLFDLPETWREQLRPDQEAAYKVLQSPARLEMVFVEQVPDANQAGQNNPAVGGVRNLGAARANAARKVLRHGLPPAEERQRLAALLQRLVEDADVQADLDEAQQQKLLLSGKLDIERHYQQDPETEEQKDAPGKIVGTAYTQVAGAKVRLPPVFSGRDSHFHKALHGRLSPGQLKKLAEAQRERAGFHREAVLAALTVTLSNRAALTDVQAQQFDDWLTENLAAPPDADDLAAWRRTTLKLLSGLRSETLKPEYVSTSRLLDDWQWPAAQEYFKEVAASARAAEARPADPLPAVRIEEEGLLGIPVRP